MGKVITFLKRNNKWLIFIISLLSISLFFSPMLTDVRKYYTTTNEFHSIQKLSTLYMFMSWSTIKFANSLSYPILCLFLISAFFAVIHLFFRKRLIGTMSNVFSIAFLSAILITCISICLPSPSGVLDEPDEFGRYYFDNFGIPHIGFYLSILLFVLSSISLIISTLDREVVIQYVKFRDFNKKQRENRKTNLNERIEILELKLQVSELQKQIEELKKDG